MRSCHMQPASEYVAAVQTTFVQVNRIYLGADQSCCECGAQRIQMIPLQREVCFLHFPPSPGPEMLRKLDPPMSNWFYSVQYHMQWIQSFTLSRLVNLLFTAVSWLRFISSNKICWYRLSGFFVRRLLNKGMSSFVINRSSKSWNARGSTLFYFFFHAV